MAKEHIEREAVLEILRKKSPGTYRGMPCYPDEISASFREVNKLPAADVVEVVHGYHEGDVCIYGFGHENKSRAIVEIVKILNDERGVAEVKFHKVFVDDTGNGLFDYLLKIGGTMNASLKYLKNITPRMDGE